MKKNQNSKHLFIITTPEAEERKESQVGACLCHIWVWVLAPFYRQVKRAYLGCDVGIKMIAQSWKLERTTGARKNGNLLAQVDHGSSLFLLWS